MARLVQCSECQDKIISLTTQIYERLRPYIKNKKVVDDQDLVYVLACLKKIENQVRSKGENDEQRKD